MEEKYKIARIFDTDKVLRKQFEDSCSYVDTVHSSIVMSDSIPADLEEIEDEILQEKHGKLINRQVFEFPPSREVEIVRIDPNINVKRHILVIIRSDRFPVLYELLENYHKGIRLVSREEKYRNLYQVYEALSKRARPRTEIYPP